MKKHEDSLPELRRDVAERINRDVDAILSDPNKNGMSKEEILELCGVTMDDIKNIRSNKMDLEL